jgi:hypothetical protein
MKRIQKNKFSSTEDRELLKLIETHGADNWEEIKKSFPARTKRQLRERYKFYIDPCLNRNNWTEEEDKILLEGQKQYGNSWKTISLVLLPNRTEIAIRNRFKQMQKEKEEKSNFFDLKFGDLNFDFLKYDLK